MKLIVVTMFQFALNKDLLFLYSQKRIRCCWWIVPHIFNILLSKNSFGKLAGTGNCSLCIGVTKLKK